MDKFIFCPEGWAVIVSYITSISPVIKDAEKVFFRCYIHGRDSQEYFNYYFKNYEDSPEELFIKVQNIRLELIKLINDGTLPKNLNGSINLTKNDK